MSKKEEKANDPLILDLAQRLSRVEERVGGLEKIVGILSDRLDRLEKRLDKIDSKTWGILTGVLISIALIILTKVI
jgi:phage shock protein A